MSTQSKLQALYDAIPTFACKPGCSDCCGPVPVSKAEWQALKLAPRTHTNCVDCEYLIDSKCSAYTNRPFMCRIFGATTERALSCPHGCGPDKPLTAKQANMLTIKYIRLTGGPVAFTIGEES